MVLGEGVVLDQKQDWWWRIDGGGLVVDWLDSVVEWWWIGSGLVVDWWDSVLFCCVAYCQRFS